MALYHKDLGFPGWLRLPEGTYRLRYTAHAILAAENDRYGRIVLPINLRLGPTWPGYIFEAEERFGECIKVCARVPYNEQYDLCLAIEPWDNGCADVRTVWLNERTDTHSTLKAGRYSKP